MEHARAAARPPRERELALIVEAAPIRATRCSDMLDAREVTYRAGADTLLREVSLRAELGR
jgi:hypothetical protein